MAVLFVAASLQLRAWAWGAYVRAFAEAAMVGGIADWFAVTALFRRPLGLPVPHTAIIPRSRERIGAALGRFIVNNFLAPRVLDARLRRIDVAARASAWLTRPEVGRAVAERLLQLAPAALKAFPEDALDRALGDAAGALVRSAPAAPAAAALLAAVWGETRAAPLIERGAELLGDYLDQHQEVVLEKVQAQSWRWLPSWVDRAIARRITAGLVQLLSDVRNPDHPWRAKLDEAVPVWIERLATDPELRSRGEALKAQLLESPRLKAEVSRLWRRLRRRLGRPRMSQDGRAQAQLQALVRDFGLWLVRDPAVSRTLNVSSRVAVRKLLAPRREAIGRFVAQVVEGWDTESVVERLELQLGPDLQYIRINGALVGGLVGLALFSLSRLLGLA
jgi:uncharacterized membrane-anchored protein YjiN (DUF445 family)